MWFLIAVVMWSLDSPYPNEVDRELIDTYPTLERCETAAEEGAMIMMQAFPFDPDTVIFVCSMSEV